MPGIQCQSCALAATGVRKAVSDYEELAKDADVDIVYVSNLHPAHRDTSILMMEHGKHVLCEKPLAVSTSLHRVVPQCSIYDALKMLAAVEMLSCRDALPWVRFGAKSSARLCWVLQTSFGIKQTCMKSCSCSHEPAPCNQCQLLQL